MPVLKNFINAFPAASRHTAEYPLRDLERHGFTSQPAQVDALGELQQCFRDPRLELAKHDVVIDEDLGLSGEVSRLARNNVEWYRLIDLAGLTDTLIGDGDGLYPEQPTSTLRGLCRLR